MTAPAALEETLPGRVRHLLDDIERADHLLRIYPASHPQPRQLCQRAAALLREITAGSGPVDLLVGRGRFTFRGEVVQENLSPSKSLSIRLHDAGLRALRFGPALDQGGLERFLGALRAASDALDDEGLLVALLWEEDIPGIAFVGAESESDEVADAVTETLEGAAGRLAGVIEALGRHGAATEPSLGPPATLGEAPRLDAAPAPPAPAGRREIAAPRGPAALLAPEVLTRLEALRVRHEAQDPMLGLLRIAARVLTMPEAVAVLDKLVAILAQAFEDLLARGRVRDAAAALTRIKTVVAEAGSLGHSVRALGLLVDALVEPRRVTALMSEPGPDVYAYLEMLDRRVCDAIISIATPEHTTGLARLFARFYADRPKDLLPFIGAREAAVSVAAADALVRLKPSLKGVDLAALVRSAPVEARPTILSAIAGIESEIAGPFMRAWLDGPDEDLRLWTLRDLSRRRTPWAYPRLSRELKDPSFLKRPEEEQQLVVKALLRADEPSALTLVGEFMALPPLVFGRAEWLRAASAAVHAFGEFASEGTRRALERIAHRSGPLRDMAQALLTPEKAPQEGRR